MFLLYGKVSSVESYVSALFSAWSFEARTKTIVVIIGSFCGPYLVVNLVLLHGILVEFVRGVLWFTSGSV